MKKKVFAAILLVVMLISTIALADFDPTIYTDAELLEIKSAIELEIESRHAVEAMNSIESVDEKDLIETPAEDFIYVSNNKEVRINAYIGYGTKVVIPAMIENVPVVGISPNAFKDNDTITSVHIPDTVSFIGEYAFYDCDAIESIRFPRYTESLKIEERAFASLDALASDIVLISDNIEMQYCTFTTGKSEAMYIVSDKLTVKEGFIDYMKNLETLYISGNTKVNYKHHFINTAAGALIDDCNSLKSIYLPSNCDFITADTFVNCSPQLKIYTAEEGKTTQAAQKSWLNTNTSEYEAKVAIIKDLLETLYPMPPRTLILLQKGSKGKDVSLMQERLNELGYSVGTPDGIFGNKSVQAISEFQTNNGLEATGIADVATQEVLFGDSAIGK